MKIRYLSRYAVALALWSVAGAQCANADEIALSGIPESGLLVLANGSVIEGAVLRDGDYYRVVLPKGKLQVPANQVDFFCRSKEEAYIRRRARRISVAPTIDAHLEMARWCIQQELFASAEAEISAARQLEPRHQQLPFMERLLRQAKELAQLPTAPSNKRDSQVVPTNSHDAMPSTMTVDIPPWARTEFIKRVQPMLVNSCATAGCHVTTSGQQLQLDRTALDGVGNPELFQRNLSAVVGMVDFSQPESSPLLIKGTSVHGTAPNLQSRPLSPHQLEILRAWVTQLLIDEPPRNIDDSPSSPQIIIGMNNSANRSHTPQPHTPTEPADPFDPAAFNDEISK